MSLEELRGIIFFFNHSATEKAMDDIMFDKYESEMNRLLTKYEVIKIKEQNNGNVS